MVVGHYALAIAAKRVAPRVSLGTLIGAALIVDLVWPVLLLLGIERVRIVPSDNPFLRLAFEWYPWTHSLLMDIVWSVLAGAVYFALRRDRNGAVVVGLLVLSHWVLDWVTHLPDMPIYPGSARVGLGLWRSVPGTMIIEAAMFIAGLMLYVPMTRPIDRTGRWAFAGLIALVTLVYIGNATSPPPSSVDVVAWGALAGWLVPLLGWWADRHRVVRQAGVD